VNSANNAVADVTTIVQAADLTITSTHSPTAFTQGDLADTYTVVVKNVGAGPTVGEVRVMDSLQLGLTPTSITSTDPNWNCQFPALICRRSDKLNPGSSYPPITIKVIVASASSVLTNTATVAGGGELNLNNNTASDPTPIRHMVTVIIATSSPFASDIRVDGVAYKAPKVFLWLSGDAHTIGTSTPQSTGPFGSYTFRNWSDGGAISHTITVPQGPATYTAFFQQ
jgi:uncharacterized repeat protein (TIGR01451 family)